MSYQFNIYWQGGKIVDFSIIAESGYYQNF